MKTCEWSEEGAQFDHARAMQHLVEKVIVGARGCVGVDAFIVYGLFEGVEERVPDHDGGVVEAALPISD